MKLHLPSQETINNLSPSLNTVLGATTIAYIGCHALTTIDPMAGALYISTMLLVSEITSPLFSKLFIQNESASEDSKNLCALFSTGVSFGCGLRAVKATGHVFTLSQALTTTVLCSVLLSAFSLLYPYAKQYILEETSHK